MAGGTWAGDAYSTPALYVQSLGSKGGGRGLLAKKVAHKMLY